MHCPFVCYIHVQFSKKCVLSRVFSLGLWIIGNRRIPSPACAYAAIRKTFPCGKDEEFTGFNLEEEDD